MTTNSPYFKFISILTLFFFLHACTSVHTLKEVPKERINEINQDNTIVIHQGDFTFKLDNITLLNSNISGQIKSYEMSKDQEILYKELHLYIKANVNNDFKYNEFISIPIQEIIKIEIYEHDIKKSTNNLILGLSALAISFFVAYGLVGSIKYLQLLR
ncbi:MAG: hypothetical protein KAS62_11145 [Candidatus Delongbacteria bacterium]|nr:hypothetical protein [Candidatus Delongbacteria bacterium]